MSDKASNENKIIQVKRKRKNKISNSKNERD